MIARRRLLSTTLLVAAAAAVPARAAAQRAFPPTRTGRSRPHWSGGAGGRIEPGFPVGHLAVSWSGAASGGTVRFRTATGWGPWQPVAAGCTAGVDRDDGRGRALLPAGGALGVELDPEPGADVRTLAINTTDGPRRTAARRAVPTDPPPGVRDRARYRNRAGVREADESLRFGPDGTELFPTAFFDVQTFTVHHTVTANADPTPAATVRAILRRPHGRPELRRHRLPPARRPAGRCLYEGRWSGPDPVPVFGPRGGRPLMCNSAHVGGFNAGNVGIALLGDLTSAQPTPAARETLVGLLAGLCALTRVDPQARVHYVNPISGATRDVDAIAGHRDCWPPSVRATPSIPPFPSCDARSPPCCCRPRSWRPQPCCCTTTWTTGPRAAPTAEFAVQGERRTTWAQARDASARAARALRAAGLAPGDRCAVLAHNCVEYLLLCVAASRAGVVLVPLNPRSAPAEWDLVVTDAAPMLLVCGPGFDRVRLPAMPVVGLDELFAPGAAPPPVIPARPSCSASTPAARPARPRAPRSARAP